jgi:primosomal protein N'
MPSMQTLPSDWLAWVSRARLLLDSAEPVLETLVKIRQESWWASLPLLRRLKPPKEVETLLELVRKLRSAL